MAVGTPPGTGPQLVDGAWLNGLAGGQNETYEYGVTAAGTNQATAFQLTPGLTLVQIDSGSSATGVALPEAVAGTEVSIYNNTSQTNIVVYPAILNNGLTGIQDTINNTTGLAFTAAHQALLFFCAKNGIWAGK